jgi:hypothetical protein
MTPSDAKLLADLDAAEKRATKGPWCRVGTYTAGVRSESVRRDGVCVSVCSCWDDPSLKGERGDTKLVSSERVENAAFIAAARNALPRLLALIAEQDAALRHAAAALAMACDIAEERGLKRQFGDALVIVGKALGMEGPRS